MIGVIDIETSGLLEDMLDYSEFPYKLKPTAKIHTVVIRNHTEDTHVLAHKYEITKEWISENLLPFDIIIAHNGIKFDFPVLKLFGLLDYTIGYLNEKDTLFGRQVRLIDTLILSRLSNPDRFGGHGLEAWGKRTGTLKTGFREVCIEKGYIEKGSPKGSEFLNWCPEMDDYCIQDTVANGAVWDELQKEFKDYDGWSKAVRVEHKLADLAVRRENLGFWFDKELALNLLEDLTEKMETLRNKVNPLLPERPMNKGELDFYTPPKNQLKQSGEYTASLLRFVGNVGAELKGNILVFDDKEYELPHHEPLRKTEKATIDDLDAVKMHLIDLGWKPTEWRERDLTKDAKKQNLSFEKRVAALDRWWKDTVAGKYKKGRLSELGYKESEAYEKLKKRLREDKPVRVVTSPSVRVGVEKDLCPHLVELGEKVAFAKDFADYLTYRHRKSSIAGGDIEDMDFDSESPNTGFLAMYREVDGRIPTPAIEIGASTNRYRHIGVANIPRASSIYGKEMRSLFGCGKDFLQFGFDYASLEARVEGNYVYDYEGGKELATTLLASKPNDLHTVTANKMGIPRDQAKSVNYGIIYGAQPAKIKKMLAVDLEKAKEIYEDFWQAVPALKKLKDDMDGQWIANGKKYIRGIDGRKINIRSQHSILNALFQSAGVIAAKYVTVMMFEKWEKAGYCIDVFKGKPDIGEMISYHDEAQLAVNRTLVEFVKFDKKEEAEEFIKEISDSEEQWSAISEGKTWYVTMPNVISKAIQESIKETEKLLNFKVPLGFEYVVNKDWYGCH